MTSTHLVARGLQRLRAAGLLHPSRFSSERTGREGQGANRVLLIGDRYALTSRSDPEVRLADHLADAVVARTGRGLELDSVWDLVPVLRAIGTATRAHDQWQYDAVVVLIHNAATRGRSTSPSTVQRLLVRVLSRLGPATPVELVFLDHPSRNQAGRAARRFSQKVMAGIEDPDRQVGSITVPSGLLDPGSDAAAVADVLAPRLPPPDASAADGPRSRSADESRTGTAEGSRAAGAPGLQRVVTLATRSFDVPFAVVSLFDGPVIRTVARTPTPGPAIERLLRAFERDGGRMTLVPDMDDDPVLRGASPGEGEAAVRFWAACPIESIAGELLGVVSVFDTVPHDLFAGDELMLHDLAQLAGAEIDSYRPDD